MNAEKEALEEKHRTVSADNAMLLSKVQDLQSSIPELEVNCDTLKEKETQWREMAQRLEDEKNELIAKQSELVAERDNLLTRCEEFTQRIYEYDVEKITVAGKMEELQNKLEVSGWRRAAIIFIHASAIRPKSFASLTPCHRCTLVVCVCDCHCVPFSQFNIEISILHSNA